MATEYIDKEEACRIIRSYKCGQTAFDDGLDFAISEIAVMPAADVRPVVYCKDCKHSDTFSSDCTEATFPLKCLSVRYGGVFPHWFCEHGERNGGADDA